MKVSNREISQQIGNLIYAIVADQHIKPLEMGELKLLISKDRLRRRLDGDESVVSDETHFILATIDALDVDKASPNDAFDEFQKFYVNHPEIFTEEVKQRILNKAEEITRIFIDDNPLQNEHLKLLVDTLGLADAGKGMALSPTNKINSL
jgi:hypothetical protein